MKLIINDLDYNNSVCAKFLDLAKAFDTCNHKMLVFILEQYEKEELPMMPLNVGSVVARVKALFFDDPNRTIWVQPAPWSRYCILG